MLSSIPQVFPFFKKGGPAIEHGSRRTSISSNLENDTASSLSLKVRTDREAYRPGDSIIGTVEVHNRQCLAGRGAGTEVATDVRDAIRIESLLVEVKGIEKLDTQWVITPKPLPGSKQRRGERVFLESTPTSVVADIMLNSGCTKTYMIRATLPKVLPPSFRGTVVRYLYYLVVTLHGRPINIENGHGLNQFSKRLLHVEARNPLHIWVTPNNNYLWNEEGQNKDHWRANGITPAPPLQVEIFWKEKENDAEWARATEIFCGEEEDDVSSREENASSTVHSHMNGSLDLAFESGLMLQSPVATPRSVSKESYFHHGERSGFTSFKMAPQMTALASETVSEAGASLQYGNWLADRPSFERKIRLRNMVTGTHALNPLYQQPGNSSTSSGAHELGQQMEPSTIEPVIGASPPAECFIRGRSYNIRIEDQVLVRFSPKNYDATYCFGDTIGGVLTFFHEEGPRRCLEVSITLETLETVNSFCIHPSRKNSPVITKIQSDYHEVVADMVQTHFMFSIPMDGPMSFTTSHVSLQWILRFEFVTTPKHVDWTKYEHPLLIEERERGEWVLPVTIHPPLSRTHASFTRKERPFSPNGFWAGSPGPAGRGQTQLPFFSELESSNREDGASSYGG